MKRSLLAVLCLALSALCISSQLVAAPHYGTPWQLKQPDGTLVNVLIWGDEYYQVIETPNGYTLMRDPSNDWIVYATLSADGNELASTGVRYTAGSTAPASVSQHVRIDPAMARAEHDRMRELAFGGVTPEQMTIGGPVAAPPSTGNVKGLVLLAEFSDIPASISKTEVENYCNQVGYSNNGNNGSVHDYFNDVSNGNLNYTFYVNDYHVGSGGTFAAYYDDCTQPWLSRGIELIKEILDEMDANGFDFSQYDANGDGEIDAINLYFTGNGTVCGWAKGMWPGSGGMGGNGWTFDGKLANRFQITNMGSTLTLGTFCHENGHMVCGWPDLYDYDPAPNVGAGVGGFDIMCNGMSSTNPVEPSAELKRTAGWLTPTDLPGSPTTDLSIAVSSGNTAWRYAKNGNEWYLIENRQKTGRDQFVPDAGLALWHIDTTGNNSNEEMLPGKHYYVTLVQADGDWDLENNNNQGDTTDLYAAPTFTAATPCTDPNTDWWDGTESALSITNISTSQTTMTFDFSDEDNVPVARVKSFSDEADEDCCIIVTVEDIDSLSYDPDGEGDIAALCIDEVDGEPITCATSVEVCGDGLHSVQLTITDLCGNTSSATASVEVIDNTPPTISVDMDRDALWPPNHKMVTVCATVTAEDNCDDTLTVALVSISSDEPDDEKGDGKTINDIQNASIGTADFCVDLRSERQGTGDGRCYTIVYSATDDAGNATLDTVCVDVPHDQGAGGFASTGFNTDGTTLTDVNSFVVLVKGTSTLDVSKVDAEHIYVGNTAGFVKASRTRKLDIDTDGVMDLATMFDHLSPSEMALVTMANVADGTGTVDRSLESDGPIGLHFVSDGTDYLVMNIYGLGAPLDLPIVREKEIEDPNALTPAPQEATDVRFPTGITSVHPNPFNPQTTVNFSLSAAMRVNISIYDVRGSLVRRLLDETKTAGAHQASWDGTDNRGQRATSGVYFLRMTAGSHSEVHKIVMLK